MNVASFVADRTNLSAWFTKCNILFLLITFFSVIGNDNTQKSQFIGLLLLKSSLEFDLQMGN